LEGKEAKKIIVRFQEVTKHITAGKQQARRPTFLPNASPLTTRYCLCVLIHAVCAFYGGNGTVVGAVYGA
jgi:hypothetical protein